MRSEENARSYWFALVGSFAGAAALAISAVVLVLQAFVVHGSLPATMLRLALGVLFLFLAVFLVAVGTLYCMSLSDEND